MGKGNIDNKLSRVREIAQKKRAAKYVTVTSIARLQSKICDVIEEKGIECLNDTLDQLLGRSLAAGREKEQSAPFVLLSVIFDVLDTPPNHQHIFACGHADKYPDQQRAALTLFSRLHLKYISSQYSKSMYRLFGMGYSTCYYYKQRELPSEMQEIKVKEYQSKALLPIIAKRNLPKHIFDTGRMATAEDVCDMLVYAVANYTKMDSTEQPFIKSYFDRMQEQSETLMNLYKTQSK